MYTATDPFFGRDELRTDKNLAIQCINLCPLIYQYISPNLRADKDVLDTLAKLQLYYVGDEPNKNSVSAKSPLSLVIDEHKRRCISTKRNRDGSIEIIKGEGFDFVEKTETDEYKINDFNLIKKALHAELNSYANSEEIYKGYDQLFQYKGIHILKALKYGEAVDSSKYMNLVSLQLASKEIFEDEICKKQIEETIQEWVQSEKAKDKEKKEEAELLSADLWDNMH